MCLAEAISPGKLVQTHEKLPPKVAIGGGPAVAAGSGAQHKDSTGIDTIVFVDATDHFVEKWDVDPVAAEAPGHGSPGFVVWQRCGINEDGTVVDFNLKELH